VSERGSQPRVHAQPGAPGGPPEKSLECPAADSDRKWQVGSTSSGRLSGGIGGNGHKASADGGDVDHQGRGRRPGRRHAGGPRNTRPIASKLRHPAGADIEVRRRSSRPGNQGHPSRGHVVEDEGGRMGGPHGVRPAKSQPGPFRPQPGALPGRSVPAGRASCQGRDGTFGNGTTLPRP
jgi:hypothetical protein